jgi:hypothetical protein
VAVGASRQDFEPLGTAASMSAVLLSFDFDYGFLGQVVGRRMNSELFFPGGVPLTGHFVKKR